MQPDPGRVITQGHQFEYHDGGTYVIKSSTMLGKYTYKVIYTHVFDLLRRGSSPSSGTVEFYR